MHPKAKLGAVAAGAGWGTSSSSTDPTYDVYVDSDFGSDSNPGTTSSRPLQTLAAATTLLGASQSVGLARGSHWRESFNLGSKTAPTVGAYGAGDAPIIDGTDIITGWTAYTTGGVAHMYSKSVTHEAGATGRLQVDRKSVV